MKKRTWTPMMLLLAGLVVVIPGIVAIAGAQMTSLLAYPEEEKWRPSPMPDRIILTWQDDPATTQSVTWRTDDSVTTPQAQINLNVPGPSFADFDGLYGGTTYETVFPFETHSVASDLGYGAALFHTVNFTDLQPQTSYLYRVGDGANWSEWFEFTTASTTADPFSFIYFGDAQNDVLEHWSRVVRRAYSDMPEARFILHAGDLIDRADADYQWGEWFKSGGWINGMVPSLATPGNHEYRSGRLSPYWEPQFAFPRNGPEGYEETVYYFDYQGVRFISLDSNRNQGGHDGRAVVDVDEQAVWLENVLKDNPNQWTVVTFHAPVFSPRPDRNNPQLREAWLPLFEEYGVDLVLQGHDHSYARGHISNMPTGAQEVSPRTGTVFVVSVSGPKMYPVCTDRFDENDVRVDALLGETQLYQLISVDGRVLSYEARDATGALFDAFEIRKLPNGNKQLRNTGGDGTWECIFEVGASSQ